MDMGTWLSQKTPPVIQLTIMLYQFTREQIYLKDDIGPPLPFVSLFSY